MKMKELLNQIDVLSQCKRYNLSLWQCPQFLFIVMGTLIDLTAIVSFVLGTRYIADPSLVALIILFFSGLLFVVAFLIVRNSQRLAELNIMKSEFITIISHQLRSPLSNLDWALDFLLSDKLGKIQEKQMEYFKILKENTKRMKKLISDLLTVSRIQRANLVQRKQLFSLSVLVSGLVKEFKPIAMSSNIVLKFQKEQNLNNVIADPDQIEQAIRNLLDNAIKYIQDGGEVVISLKNKRNYVYCEVKDNGIGIPKRDQKFIFKRFFRSKNVIKQQTDGSGLGLFIAKSIIERSGGKIGFKSTEGKGTIFWFVLPARE